MERHVGAHFHRHPFFFRKQREVFDIRMVRITQQQKGRNATEQDAGSFSNSRLDVIQIINKIVTLNLRQHVLHKGPLAGAIALLGWLCVGR